MVDGPERALQLIDAIEARGTLKGYEVLPAVRADLLRRLGRHDAARQAYLAATAATQLEPLRRLYARRMAELDQVATRSGLPS
jgi:RNA polymerase sigma-70 factor (ECF subfamily)